MSSLEPCFTHEECHEFLSFFLNGILNRGLLVPLKEFSIKNETSIGRAARSWYDLQVAGYAPQIALHRMSPKFPRSLEDILVLGIEKSVLDMVLMDTLKVYQETLSVSEIEKALRDLFRRYSTINSSLICVDGWQAELQKIINRAKTEGAKQVILNQEGEEFLHQRYIATKLIHVIEPSISMIYLTLKKTLDELVAKCTEIKIGNQNFKVQGLNEFEFCLRSHEGDLIVTFAT